MNSITIGPLTLPIHEPADMVDHGLFRSSPEPHICINPKLKGQIRAMALLHECIEAICWVYGIRATEQTVRNLEVAITDLLRENPALVDGLRAGTAP